MGLRGTYVACEEDIGLLESSWSRDSSVEFTVDVGLSLLFGFFTTGSGGSFSTGSCSLPISGLATSGGIGSSSNGNEDTPFAVHVGNSKSELILIGLEFDLSQGFVDDEGICLGAELADLSVGDVETDDVGAWMILTICHCITFEEHLLAGSIT